LCSLTFKMHLLLTIMTIGNDNCKFHEEIFVTVTFAMNRTCAPQLSLPEFLRLVKGAGISAIEIRNDIEGQEFMDGTEPAAILDQLHAANIKIASVNALQRFNDWSEQREAEAKSLIGYAAKLGAPGVVLCPVHNIDHGWTEAEAERNLREGLKQLRAILLDLGVKGYVEPLGMMGSTMKRQSMAVAAITDIGGWDAYELCFDTFQFFRCGDTVLFPEHIGLAHVSGITRNDLEPGELTEPDRVLIGTIDRVDNTSQLRALKQSGYVGYVSMEPFNNDVQQSPELQDQLQESFARMSAALNQAASQLG
jgi:2-keto-myo-inositol isomerase